MDVASDRMVPVDLSRPLWESFFLASPLVLIGTKEEGGYNLAPKHMAMPMGWDAIFGFMCAPTHGTYVNVRDSGVFTVSFPSPDQVVTAGLAATSRRETDGEKPILKHLPTIAAESVDGVLVAGAAIAFECELERIVDGFGRNSLIAGRIVAAYVREAQFRASDTDDQDLIYRSPILTYLHPGRYAVVRESFAFPFPTNFEK